MDPLFSFISVIANNNVTQVQTIMASLIFCYHCDSPYSCRLSNKRYLIIFHVIESVLDSWHVRLTNLLDFFLFNF